MDIKSVRFELKTITETGIFEGYASTWTTDLGGDILIPGAFKKSLNDHGGDVPILWMHQDLIGKNLEAREDSRGLWVRGQINLDVQKGREAYSLARQGAVKGLSIGFMPIQDKTTYRDDGTRELREVKWFEYSLTPLPMNPEARITSIKENRHDERDEVIEALRGVHNDLRKFYSKLLG